MLMLLGTPVIKKHNIIRKHGIVRNTISRIMFTRDENGYLNSRAGVAKYSPWNKSSLPPIFECL